MEKSIWQILKEAPLNDEEGAESMGDWEQVEARILEIVQKEGFDLTGSDSCESLLHYPKGWYQGHFPFQARGMTLSHWAAHLNYPNLWKFLKSHNGISQQPDAKGMLPIHHACSSGAKDIFKDLIDSVDRSTLNARNRFGQTLLHLSIHHEDTDFAKKLLEKGANPNIQDRNRETPLHYASQYGTQLTEDLLIRHGADPYIVSTQARTPNLHTKHFPERRYKQRNVSALREQMKKEALNKAKRQYLADWENIPALQKIN